MRGIKIGWCVSALALVLLGPTMTAFAQPKPDLMVTSFQVTNERGFVKKVTVKVTNVCTVDAGASYVMVSFKESAQSDAKTIHHVGNTVPALKAGASSTQELSMTGFNLGTGLHILVQADAFKKVAEASEDNNWWTVNPLKQPSKLSGPWQCSPKM